MGAIRLVVDRPDRKAPVDVPVVGFHELALAEVVELFPGGSGPESDGGVGFHPFEAAEVALREPMHACSPLF